jgi:hypothetical protein
MYQGLAIASLLSRVVFRWSGELTSEVLSGLLAGREIGRCDMECLKLSRLQV